MPQAHIGDVTVTVTADMLNKTQEIDHRFDIIRATSGSHERFNWYIFVA